MQKDVNRQVRLIRRPSGVPQATDFEIGAEPMPLPGPGQVRVRNLYLSVEPAMRGWVNAAPNYSDPVPLGAVMRSYTVGRIDLSNHSDWAVGTIVTGLFGWQDYAAIDPTAIARVVAERDLPVSTSLGILGTNGVTAHYGLLKIGKPRAGETVVVSTAAGAVGSCVGQIAKIKGCRTVGIAGGPEKVRQCREIFGYDEAVDYKCADFELRLAEACAGGVDVYYDNTSGPISDEVMKHLNLGARVVVCGTAAIANWDPIPQGPRVQRHLLVKRASMQGFVIFDHPEHYSLARGELAQWIREGRLRYVEDILEGIEQAPDAIAGLYRGENMGKRLIRIGDE
ncbi:NADP-dependent oxidoreductase [Cupriavidus necator]|uniref:NADP-dependent oxidoreductase n=1 Tax=Cupriavidus necator TaxID=106590 RepID=A0A367PG47_CUPNE|nr:NADP-dependent oxidoreductase [Cupriavidus necator]QQX86660.1 NADP-dependent oxidoreductase [Cupriavidus necator]RCJ06850.1 NADP-dependent oxidoreductase [Cupriavidus necator]